MTRIVKYLFFFILLLGAGAQEMCAQPMACHFWQECLT